MLYLVGVLFFVVAMVVSIALHEIGHLVAAKTFRVRCPKYFVGFGSTLWSRQVGETEYGVKAIPLGGFVSMVGGYAPKHDVDRRPPRTALGRWARQLADDTRAADAEQLLPTDTDRVIYALPWWKQCIIYVAGPAVNLVIATLIVGGIVVGHGIPQASTQVRTVVTCLKTEASKDMTACGPGDKPSPASQAGLKPGDRIVAIDGERVEGWDALSGTIRAGAGKAQRWTVTRDGQEQQLTVTPQVAQRYVLGPKGEPELGSDGKPKVVQVGYVGVAPTTEYVKGSATQVPGLIGEQLWATAKVVVKLPVKLWDIAVSTVSGTPRDPNGPMSIVGTGRISGEILEGGSEGRATWSDRMLTFASLVAGLNMALFVFNMIPLLPLDGGHVLTAVWQAVKRGGARLLRRPDPGYVDKAAAMPFALGVIAFFIAMTALLVVADIINPVRISG